MYVPHCATEHRFFLTGLDALAFRPPTQNKRYVYRTEVGWCCSWSTYLLVMTRDS